MMEMNSSINKHKHYSKTKVFTGLVQEVKQKHRYVNTNTNTEH